MANDNHNKEQRAEVLRFILLLLAILWLIFTIYGKLTDYRNAIYSAESENKAFSRGATEQTERLIGRPDKSWRELQSKPKYPDFWKDYRQD